MWLWVLNNKRLVFILALSAGLAWFMWRADELGEERDALEDQVHSYQQVVADMQKWHDDTTAALERKTEDDRKRNEFKNAAISRNTSGRASGDGPLAPVLRDGLRELGARQARGKENP